jgi:exopolysaccharide biosynthesis polyprenyl glycosylphosphotransferase
LLRRTLKGALALAAVWVAGAFYLKLEDPAGYRYSRAAFTMFIMLTTAGLVGARVLLADLSRRWRAHSGRYIRALLFGGELQGEALLKHLANHLFVPVKVLGVTGEVNIPGTPRLTEAQALEQIKQGRVDYVLLDVPLKKVRLIFQVAQAAEREGIPIQITSSIARGLHLKPYVDKIGRTHVIELSPNELSLSGLILKRTLDLTIATVGLAIGTPLMIAISLLIKVTSRGPVLYTQKRVGLNGRGFRMYKFRTMKIDAEQNTGPVWAQPHDPRVTPIGKFLRRRNLDELPQLWNVLKGEMSIVGPRPERPEFVEQFKPLIKRYSHKHWVKPGMTGWAQVHSFRGNTDLNRRIAHDIYYIERWSLALDFKILALTLTRGHRNAY